MNIYLCKQYEVSGWDTYSSFVCAANNEDEARNIHPMGGFNPEVEDWIDGAWDRSGWCSYPSNVEVMLVGVASEGTEAGIILASYHAG